ncbi:unnamed protein product [Mucor hiemalis]
MERNTADRHIPCPDGCDRHFKTGAGLASHRRGSTCTARIQQQQQQEQEPRAPSPPAPARRSVTPPNNLFRREMTPNLLYMTAIEGNMDPCEDDDFSVISERLVDFAIPDDILLGDDFTPAREDGRIPGVIGFVQNVVRARPPLRGSTFGEVILNLGQGSFIMFDIFLKFLVIYFFWAAIYFCHDGKCAAKTNAYFADSEKVKDLFDDYSVFYDTGHNVF